MTQLDRLSLMRRIDALLAPWLDKPVPGMTIGVVQDGTLAVHRSAGLASLALGVPIGPQTLFRIASVSKQFTCAAVLMLAAEGKLGLDDKASDHVPGLPDLGVTIRHMMHNCSGMRDMLEIMRQGGADLGTPLRIEDLLDGIKRQQTLNFRPNTGFLYSNTNFLLLGVIVEAVTGEDLADFLQRRIFTPLGMTRTRMTKNLAEPVPGLATGYMPGGSGYNRAAHAFPLHGEGGLVSCIEDLAIWSHHLDTDGAALAVALSETLPFANGAANIYARGQTVRTHRGVVTVAHGGLWPGFKTEFLRAPALGVTVIAISNNGGADPNGLGVQVLDLLLDAIPGMPPAPQRPAPSLAAALEGRWVAPDRSATLDAVMEAGRLVLRANGVPSMPFVLADGWVGAAHGSTMLAVRPAEGGCIEVERSAGVSSVWHRAAPGGLPAGLAGTYVSAEMAATWIFAEEPDGWRVRVQGPVVAAGGPWAVTPIDGECVRVAVPGSLYDAWLDVRAVMEGGAVVTLLASGGRVKNVRYERVG
jgi:CubicO group peptidase (beta-lactamase class C family)